MLGVIPGAVLPITGCLSGLGLSDEPGFVLTRLSIQNASETARTVTVTVLYDGTTVHAQEYDAGRKKGNRLGGEVIDAPPADQPVDIEIRAAMGEQIRVFDPTEMDDDACIMVMVRIERNGRLTFLSSNEGTDCLDTTPTETGGGVFSFVRE